MINHSRLPEVVGDVGPEWHENWPPQVLAGGVLIVSALGEKPVAPKSSDKWLEDGPGIVDLLQIIDDDYRQRFDYQPEQPLKHKIDFRAGAGNNTAIHERLVDILPRSLREHKKHLSRSVVHMDVAYKSDLPEDNDPGIIYSVADGATTEWFPGRAFVPIPRERIFKGYLYVPILAAMAKLQTLTTPPRRAPSNHLLVSRVTDLHRAPRIDLSERNRWFFRDYVIPKPERIT